MHIHKYSPLAPLADGTGRWFKLCLRGTCGKVKLIEAIRRK